ncbi:hypothetical protein LINPERPRIM_LOCUS30025 [Linum perenne]
MVKLLMLNGKKESFLWSPLAMSTLTNSNSISFSYDKWRILVVELE